MELNEFANLLRRSSNPSDYLSRMGFGSRWTQTSGSMYLRDQGYGRQLTDVTVSNPFADTTLKRNPGTIPYVTAGIRKNYNRPWDNPYSSASKSESRPESTSTSSYTKRRDGEPTSRSGVGQALMRRLRKARGFEDPVPLAGNPFHQINKELYAMRNKQEPTSMSLEDRPENVKMVMAARENIANWQSPGTGATSSVDDSIYSQINRNIMESRNRVEPPVPLSQRPPDLSTYRYQAPTSDVRDRPFAALNERMASWTTPIDAPTSSLKDRPERVKMVMAARENISKMSSSAKKANAKNPAK